MLLRIRLTHPTRVSRHAHALPPTTVLVSKPSARPPHLTALPHPAQTAAPVCACYDVSYWWNRALLDSAEGMAIWQDGCVCTMASYWYTVAMRMGRDARLLLPAPRGRCQGTSIYAGKHAIISVAMLRAHELESCERRTNEYIIR